MWLNGSVLRQLLLSWDQIAVPSPLIPSASFRASHVVDEDRWAFSPSVRPLRIGTDPCGEEGHCDGSDCLDPHTSATGAAAVGDDPEVIPRSQLPIGSFLHSRDFGNLKAEIPEIEGVEERRGNGPGDVRRRTPKSVKSQRQGGTLGVSRIPEVGGRAERRISTDPTCDEDRRPREAVP
ncbi:hypothetical protein NDU88_006132 [Pleurodeles waltl]|uniref:Uncharacterized protein n=1 Tax=Pleurodeles waltl TaxID=8319 RepID=A0AAV7NS72_PLEWA|nr:hypothetical protein NDU88_006132 [Pleurodeles waltl]